jgi:hypothetical protein
MLTSDVLVRAVYGIRVRLTDVSPRLTRSTSATTGKSVSISVSAYRMPFWNIAWCEAVSLPTKHADECTGPGRQDADQPPLRVADWRVVYEVHDGRLVIKAVAVAHRREIYD